MLPHANHSVEVEWRERERDESAEAEEDILEKSEGKVDDTLAFDNPKNCRNRKTTGSRSGRGEVTRDWNGRRSGSGSA